MFETAITRPLEQGTEFMPEQDIPELLDLTPEALGQRSLPELREVKDKWGLLIIWAIRGRNETVEAIGLKKTAAGTDIRVHAEELRALRQAEAAAKAAGVNPDTVVDLFNNLFRDAREFQAAQRRNIAAAAIREVASSGE